MASSVVEMPPIARSVGEVGWILAIWGAGVQRDRGTKIGSRGCGAVVRPATTQDR
jgi:hypothetical protein